MYICEYLFDRPDSDNPKYSQHEVDYYAWAVDPTGKMPSHRLSLRKNLETAKFEVYRRFNKRQVMRIPDGIFITHEDTTGIDSVALEGNFADALEFADNEWECWHGNGDHERDKPCQHEYSKQDSLCPKRRR